MLRKFSVTNFKNFDHKIVLELDKPANYEFNSEIIKDNCVSKGIIYGINGSGKSNLALALFDIILHLTDKERALDKYQLYLNMNSASTEAEFEYLFSFDNTDVKYSYGKADPLTLTYECLEIGGRTVLEFDYKSGTGSTSLDGAQTLQIGFNGVPGTEKLSRVKYVKSNALLADNAENHAFKSFTSFVDNMLMFYSLNERRYQGFDVGSESFTRGIIQANKLKDFEAFLRKQGVDYDLVSIDINGQSEIACKFQRGLVPFATIASTGTNSLALFYYWYIKMQRASFVVIDEYDAFYHFELAQEVVQLIKQLPDTQVFLTTHNTDLISNDLLRPDAYFLLKDNSIKSFDKISEKELRRAHNIQKMYKAGAFNG